MALHNWIMLLHSLLRGCCSVVTQPIAPSSNIGSNRVVGRSVLASQDVFKQHAADLLTVLEGTARHVAVLMPSSNSEKSAALLAAVATVASLCQGSLLPLSGGLEGRPAALQTLALEAGPGFQTQLYSLLCSLAKLSGCALVGSAHGFAILLERFRHKVTEDALMLLVAPTPDAAAAFQVANAANARMLWDQEPVIATAAVEEAVGDVVAAAAKAAAAGAVKAVHVLPSLVILGRCCLQWAQELEVEVHPPVQQPAEGLAGHVQQTSARFSASAMCCRKVGQMSRMEYLVLLVQQWLQAGSHSAELSAAGYAAEAVLQQLEQLLAAVRATQVTSSSSSSSGEQETPGAAAYAAITKHLRSTGLALCALAVPCMCNYPGCTKVSGLTELGTVSGRSCMCGGCRVARYCSRVCQKRHWKQHKLVCAALAAARAAVAPAAPV